MIGKTLAKWLRQRRAVRRRFNPYLVGMPVLDRSLFFGREHLLRRALARLDVGNVSVTGERRIGKTSLLHNLRCVLASRAREAQLVLPIFADFEFLRGADVFGTLRSATFDAPAVVRERPPYVSPNGAGRDRELTAQSFPDFESILGALASWTQRPVRLVYLVDEIDALGDAGGIGEREFSKLVCRAPEEVRFVTAGVRPAARNGSEACVGRQAFEQIDLAALSAEAAEALVQEPVAGVFDYERPAIVRILERSGLRPYQIQRLCFHALEHMLDEDRTVIREADVDAVERLLASGWERSAAPSG